MTIPNTTHCRVWMMLAVAALTCALSVGSVSAAYADPSTPQPTYASDKDSLGPQWSHIESSRYGDIIRKTDRVTYPDAGTVLTPACDMTGDGNPDMVFVQPSTGVVHVVDHIPFGSLSDQVSMSIEEQDGRTHVSLASLQGAKHVHASCLPGTHDQPASLVIAADQHVGVLRAGQLEVETNFNLPQAVSALTVYRSSTGTARIAAGVGNELHILDMAGKEQQTRTMSGSVQALATVEGTVDGSIALAVGVPEADTVSILNTSATKELATLKGTEGTAFGSAITRTADMNHDDRDDVAVGAPQAYQGAGAVALVYVGASQINVALQDVPDVPVTDGDGEASGTVLRQNIEGRFGTSLAWADGDGLPGALIVGRPVNQEHPGALVISEKVLGQNWVKGRGIDEIPSGQWAWLASDEDTSSDAGALVGIIPRRSDDALLGVYTADSRGKVDVWTVDFSHQNDSFNDGEDTTPKVPQPPAPSSQPGLTPTNTDQDMAWLGEFTSGLGGSVARGTCDVTGDGKPDLISGNAVRSEWKYDPYYAESTPTKGWVPNVTGQIQVIPGGTPAGSLPLEGVISINGPVKTQDPAVDANLGFSVACAGDVNGDNVDDIVAGSVTMGRVWVLYGGPRLGAVDLNDLDYSLGFDVHLPVDGAPAFQVSTVGDVDEDGKADVGFVVANASYAAGDTTHTVGSAFVVKGDSYRSPVNLTEDLMRIDQSHPSVLMRIDLPNGHTMNSFTRVGDVNADGYRDFVVTDFQAADADQRLLGQAWIVYGGPDMKRVDLSQPFEGYTLKMVSETSQRLGAGTSVANLGDLDGDGTAEFVIGFDGGQIISPGAAGVAIVYGIRHSGSEQSKAGELDSEAGTSTQGKRTINLQDWTQIDPGISVIMDKAGTSFGYAVDAHPATENGDDARIIVGAYSAEAGDGAVYVINVQDLPVVLHNLDSTEMNSRVRSISSLGPKARFGRSVAFTYLHTDQLWAIGGGDGVIDEEPSEANGWNETKGFAHTAHLRTTLVATVKPLPKPSVIPTPTQSVDDSSQKEQPHAATSASSSEVSAPSDDASISSGSPNGRTASSGGSGLVRSGSTALITVGLALLLALAGVSLFYWRRKYQ